jgi:hypothetical protein
MDVASLVRETRPQLAVERGSLDEITQTARGHGPPRLWIDAADSVLEPRRGPRSPRLRLEDCPRDEWSAEVRAAIECVWPLAK